MHAFGPTAALISILGLTASPAAGASGFERGDPRTVPLTLDDGARVQQRQPSFGGVVVRHAYETLRGRADGPVRVVASDLPRAAPQADPDDARIEVDELPELVAEILDASEPVAFESTPQLVYLSRQGVPVLAWEVQLPLSILPEPSRKTLWISAMSGRLLDEHEQVRSSRAWVFEHNPSSTPVPVEVTLTGLQVETAGEPLAGDRVVSLNCLSEEPAEVVPYWDEGECYPAHAALSDDNGDFFVPLPDIVDVAANRDGDDAYAEVSMYYHAERFLDVMRQKGVEEFKCERATMLANFRTLEPDGDLDFTPLNNAYYTNQCDGEKGATMLFGQGSDVDFGYDGDVVYHELGHGMVALLTPEGLSGTSLRSDGASPDAGAINEAVADYFAFMLTGDPYLGEYVGRFWSSNTRPYIRSGENERRCPDNFAGQVHNDGEPFQAALWAVRSRLGEVVDDILLEALTRMPHRSTIEEGTAAVLAVAQEALSAGALDDEGFALFQRSFGARGLIDCPRVITEQADVVDGRTMYIVKDHAGIQPFMPGPMQLRYEVPLDATRAEVVFDLRSRGNDAADAVVLVKRGDERIHFEYDVIGVDDPGDASGVVGKIREVTHVSGDWDLEVEPAPVVGDEFVARLEGLRPGEVLHIALGGRSGSNQVARGVAIRTPGHHDDADSEGDTDGEPEPASGRDEVHTEGAQAGSCGCRSGAGGPGWAWLWMTCWMLGPRRRQ